MKQYNTDKERMQFYKGARWRKLRQQVLQEQNHECQECKRNGRVTLANPDKHKSLDVDHIEELADRLFRHQDTERQSPYTFRQSQLIS